MKVAPGVCEIAMAGIEPAQRYANTEETTR